MKFRQEGLKKPAKQASFFCGLPDFQARIYRFLVVLGGSWRFLVVLSGSWWLLVVFSGS